MIRFLIPLSVVLIGAGLPPQALDYPGSPASGLSSTRVIEIDEIAAQTCPLIYDSPSSQTSEYVEFYSKHYGFNQNEKILFISFCMTFDRGVLHGVARSSTIAQ